METSEVRRAVLATIERSKRNASERQARADEAGREYQAFLDRIAVPICRQVASALKAEAFPFTVFTPGGSVRLMSDKSSQDYVEIALDTTGDRPLVMGHTSRARGRRVMESERPLHDGPVREITEDQVLGFFTKELEGFVEK